MTLQLTPAVLAQSSYERGEFHRIAGSPGETLVVQNDYGKVRIRGTDSSSVDLTVRKTSQDPRQLENVRILAQRTGSKIYVTSYFYQYAAESAQLELVVPHDLNVIVWGANPEVDLSEVRGYVRIHTLTGSIAAQNLASAALFTEAGNISYSTSRQPGGDVRLESVTGNIDCRVVQGLNLRYWGRAGKQIAWNGLSEEVESHLERQSGRGGPLLYAHAAHGSVRFEEGLSQQGWEASPSAQTDQQIGITTGAPPLKRSTGTPSPPDSRPEELEADQPPAPISVSHPAGGEPVSRGGTASVTADGDTVNNGYSLRLDVNWIYLNASVRDAYSHRSVPHLRREDFEVYEDGVTQTVERFSSTEAPFHLLLLLDVSGSTQSYIDMVERASTDFTREIRSDDRVALAAFNSKVRLIQDFTSDRAQLSRAIGRIRAKGGTAFYDALDTCIRDYMSGVEGRKAIVVFTDGVDSQLAGDYFSGSRLTFDDLYRQVQATDEIIYTRIHHMGRENCFL